MEKLLSKQEIDDLLKAVFEGRIEPEKELAKSQGGVVSVDLFGADVHKGYVPNLDLIYDSFIRSNRVTLSNRLRKMVEIKKVRTTPLKFDDYLQTLPSPVCMAIFKIEPLKAAAIISMDANMVFTIVDGVLGGSGGGSPSTANRSFTSIELKLMEKVVKDALGDLEKAWQPLCPSKMSLLRMELNPRLVSVVPPDYQVLTTTLQIQIDDIFSNMTFAIPYITIDPIRDKLKSGVQLDIMAIDPSWSFRLSSGVSEAPLDMTVEMGNCTITLEELMHLEPGDTIVLDKPCREELVIKVGGVPKFYGNPGSRFGNKAVQVTRPVNQGAD